jgi:hypothetical protein
MTGVEARTMTNDEFQKLLEERDEAERNHAEWCEEYADQDVCDGRERAYARFKDLQDKVEDALVDAECCPVEGGDS